MNRSKYSVFILVMTAIMLLVVGNWVTSAQATSAVIIDATPMPTGTPAEDPDILGEIPSAEEQEELKAIVQSYIDLHYRALSVSDAEDFKQNGFGSLISETSEAKTFLSEEMAKLAVEIKHAQLVTASIVEDKKI